MKFIRKKWDKVPSSTGENPDFKSSSPAWSFTCHKFCEVWSFLPKKNWGVIQIWQSSQKSSIWNNPQPQPPSTKAPSHHRTPVCQRDAAAAARAFTACRCRSWVRCVSRSAAFGMRWDEVGGRRWALGDSWVKNDSSSHNHGFFGGKWGCIWCIENECIMYLQYEDPVSFHLI